MFTSTREPDSFSTARGLFEFPATILVSANAPRTDRRGLIVLGDAKVAVVSSCLRRTRHPWNNGRANYRCGTWASIPNNIQVPGLSWYFSVVARREGEGRNGGIRKLRSIGIRGESAQRREGEAKMRRRRIGGDGRLSVAKSDGGDGWRWCLKGRNGNEMEREWKGVERRIRKSIGQR